MPKTWRCWQRFCGATAGLMPAQSIRSGGGFFIRIEHTQSYLLDWANLLLRWVHVITAIACFGGRCFVFLDSSLTPPVDADLKCQGASGELGGCARVQRADEERVARFARTCQAACAIHVSTCGSHQNHADEQSRRNHRCQVGGCQSLV